MNLMVTYHHMARTPLKIREINEFDGNIPSHGSNTTINSGKLMN